MNFQSVIESPERVSRVIPPSMTKQNTQLAHPKSHNPTAFCAWGPFVTSSFNPEFAAPLAVVEFNAAAVVDNFLVHWPNKVLGARERKAWKDMNLKAEEKAPAGPGLGGRRQPPPPPPLPKDDADPTLGWAGAGAPLLGRRGINRVDA